MFNTTPSQIDKVQRNAVLTRVTMCGSCPLAGLAGSCLRDVTPEIVKPSNALGAMLSMFLSCHMTSWRSPRTRDVPRFVRRSARLASALRLTDNLAVAEQHSFAVTLFPLRLSHFFCADGEPPLVIDALRSGCLCEPPPAIRLPPKRC